MELKQTKHKIRTIDMVQIALMAAIVYVVTAMINVPVGIGGNKAVLHLGDSIVFLAAVLLGKKKAAIAAAIGMSLFDLLSPYAIWAPYTFVIKGIMGYIAAVIAYRSSYKGENILNNIFSFAIAGIWMIGGYYLAGIIIELYGNVPLNQAAIAELTYIPANIAQVIVGIIIAVPISEMLRRSNVKKIINK